jgi:uncharacterized protein (DUF1919 family)
MLKLPFTSPFINTLMNEENYIRLTKDLRKYCELPLEEVKSDKQYSAPMGRLGDVEIRFIHHSSFKSAKLDWDRRVTRINYDNIFTQLTSDGSLDVIKEFLENPERRKVVFSTYPHEIENNVFISDWNSATIRMKYSYRFEIFVLGIVSKYVSSCPLDILKLLLGEGDYIKKY